MEIYRWVMLKANNKEFYRKNIHKENKEMVFSWTIS